MKRTWKAGIFKRKRLVAALVVIAIIVVLGFAAGLMLTAPAPVPAPMPTPAPIPAPTPAPEGVTDLEVVGRKIIYDGWLSLEVSDVDVAADQIKSIAEEMGGYISQTSISKGDSVKTGSVTLRVPQADFYTVIERIELLGNLKNKNIGSEDVTERYVDLKARLENAQYEEKRLLEIMDKADQVSDMLEIERELSRIREQIEVYTGQLTYLESRVEYATITVTLSEPRPAAPLPEVDWDATVKTGLQGLFVVIQGLIYLAFIIIPIAAIGIPIYYVYKWRRRKKAGA